ncbi:hypothetical protein HMPREF9488_02590 [Coprobacillus cateniformis]|jgi:GH25 family lysozyme M1 (1,4-beta-N-acetylmuramidase)|uniref:Cpl-7 lysozyme C-terminal domain-containing protein n=1 Tax=Coprobacillus cateniformis TaxID=100884 RepID=E7GCU8_9FIRM|nr:GH25 family lysozyme [Coprobacillus cateniformis]EFW04307.1 hypothetical protein HMPREF9488_02590 [Coprobacillus cateniformis]
MKEFGLDLSKHNGDLNFTAIKNAANNFVILRAGYGNSVSQKDTKFEEYYKSAKTAGLKVGVYWYSYALTPSEAIIEAKCFYEVIKGKQFEYPVYFDIENRDHHKGASNAELVKMCQNFCDFMESKGYLAGVYANTDWFTNYISGLPKGKYNEWEANYGLNDGTLQDVKLVRNPHIHQFTSNYELNNKKFDRNVSYFDFETVIKERGLNGFSKNRLGKLTDNQVANEIIQGVGEWGNGDERKKKLGLRYTAIQNIVNKKLLNDKPIVLYYKSFNSTSIVDGLKSIGINSSLETRKKIAKANGISNYNGNTSDNVKLLKLARQGKLKKA